MQPTILAIESSCDETSASIIKKGKVLNNITATQSVHENYGGVVPELASREHQKNIVPVVSEALKTGKVSKSELDAIAFTQGPGLLGSLLVGSSFAKSMAAVLNIPLIEVNHMQAHVLSHFIDDPAPAFPFLCLTVSGGHTQLILVDDFLKMKVIGQTKDDAAGEAFDKAAKMLGLKYPGGPIVDELASKGNPEAFSWPDTDIPDFDYSFSGIKTAILYFLRDQQQNEPDFIEKNINDLCASIQNKIIEMLFEKLVKASKSYNVNQIAIAGGVSANSGLRKELSKLAEQNNWEIFIPKVEYCTDNAAMIAMTAHYKYLNQEFSELSVSPSPRLYF